MATGRRGRADTDLVVGERTVRLPRTLRALIATRRSKGRYATYCVSRIPGGVTAAIEVYRLFADTDATAQSVVEAWDEKQRIVSPKATLEEALEQADVSPEDFIALLSRFLTRLGTGQAQLVAAAAYPHIMEASVERALDPEKGHDERRLHLEHAGFVQPRSGIRIGIQQNNNNRHPEDEPPGPGEAQSFDRTARAVVRNLPLLPE